MNFDRIKSLLHLLQRTLNSVIGDERYACQSCMIFQKDSQNIIRKATAFWWSPIYIIELEIHPYRITHRQVIIHKGWRVDSYIHFYWKIWTTSVASATKNVPNAILSVKVISDQKSGIFIGPTFLGPPLGHRLPSRKICLIIDSTTAKLVRQLKWSELDYFFGIKFNWGIFASSEFYTSLHYRKQYDLP